MTSYSSVPPPGEDRIENTVSLLLLPVFVFTDPLPGNALILFVTLYLNYVCIYVQTSTFKWAGAPFSSYQE
jgi:hypothetical protein